MLRYQEVERVNTEMDRAEATHGALTEDSSRAFLILSEEVGEVAKELLILKRDSAAKERAVSELYQVVSTCVFMIRNLSK